MLSIYMLKNNKTLTPGQPDSFKKQQSLSETEFFKSLVIVVAISIHVLNFTKLFYQRSLPIDYKLQTITCINILFENSTNFQMRFSSDVCFVTFFTPRLDTELTILTAGINILSYLKTKTANLGLLKHIPFCGRMIFET